MATVGDIALEPRRTFIAALSERLLAERERWPLWLPVLMGGGIAIFFMLDHEPARWIGGVALAAVSIISLLAWRLARWVIPCSAIIAVALGFAAAQFEAWWVAAPVLDRRLGPVEITGRLVSVDPLPEGARLVIAPSHVGDLGGDRMPARLRVRLRKGDGGVVPGDWLTLRAMLMPPPAPSTPGAYDFQRAAWFQRLGAVGYALGAPKTIDPPAGESISWWRHAVEALRTAVTQRIRVALPERSGAIAAAIIAGQTHDISPDDAGAFRDAGLAHILVIAGLHMGMAAGAAFFALRALFALIPAIALNYSTKKWAASGALGVVFIYMLLSGATVSSRRAFVMIGLVLLAILVDRVSVSARAIALAAVVVMLMTPDAATGPSFQMSFAAVSCIIAFYETMRPQLSAWHRGAGPVKRFGLYVLGLAFTTIVTTLATAPFTIYHFNRFPLYSVIANAIAVPIAGFWVMPWAIASCLMMPFGIEKLALVPMSWGIDAISWVGHTVTSWPGAVMQLPSPSSLALALIGMGGLWFCIWLGRWRWWGLVLIALGIANIAVTRPPDLLIAGDMRLIAVRADDGNYLPSATRGEAVVADTWTRRAAAQLGPIWPASGSADNGALVCDSQGCFYRRRSETVALIRDGAALAEDCRSADLIVAPVAAHRACHAAHVIDRIDTYQNGGYAVWLDPGNIITVATVRDWQGDRLWSPHHASATTQAP
ncbi:MAG TPA: ComEC/Rec2 family competence protein [Stellaceae bacterium]|jgi:competence protein ComEC|nr:ComEC/Rec2 family competence protein [Stellaceae bacterium]